MNEACAGEEEKKIEQKQNICPNHYHEQTTQTI